MNFKFIFLTGIFSTCLFFNLFCQTGVYSTMSVISGSVLSGGNQLNGGTTINNGLVLGGEVRSLGWEFKIGHSPSHHFVYYDFKNKMYFKNISNGNISPLLLQNDGSVVINSQTNYSSTALYNTQGFKLAVNGGILCEEIKVILDVPQFDIVFEPDYKLMSLYDTELYIKKHKHLPDVPSALEFRTNGYKLGEMDGLLLKKTEELTLHMIRIQKELDAFSLQNSLLEQKTTLLEEEVKLLKEENEKLKLEMNK